MKDWDLARKHEGAWKNVAAICFILVIAVFVLIMQAINHQPYAIQPAQAANAPAQASENCDWMWTLAKDSLKKAAEKAQGADKYYAWNAWLEPETNAELATAANNLYRTCMGR